MTLHELLSKPAAEWTQADIDACVEQRDRVMDEAIGKPTHATDFAEGLKMGHSQAYRHVLEVIQIVKPWNK
jgi:hypothetical protein